MDKELSQLQVNNVICEGHGCFKKAATKTNVRVGQLGSISLDLCADCVKKFDENHDTDGLKQSSKTKEAKKRYTEAIEQ